MEIQPSKGLKGQITVPGDKSVSHRGVMMGALAEGTTEISGFLSGEDCLSTISCFRQMGVEIACQGDCVTVCGRGLHGLQKPEKMLYTGNSGTTTRMLCGILAPQRFSCTIGGDASIAKRPMDRVIVPLREMGADIRGTDGGHTPLTIKGTALHGITYQMPVASAQLKSALLFAGLQAEGKTVLHEPSPSRDHTERMLRAFGAEVISDGCTVTVKPAERLNAGMVRVPGDISSAAFFLVAGLIVPGSVLRICGVGLNETRTGIIEVLRAMGGKLTIEHVRDEGEPMGDIVVESSALHGTEVGGSLIPRLIDEIPVIAVAAAFAQGKTVIRDAAELRVKESDRITAVETELRKAGVDVTGTADGLIIEGGRPVHGAEFATYGDHRMAMALAVLAQAAQGVSQITDPDCIAISYPTFWDTLASLNR